MSGERWEFFSETAGDPAFDPRETLPAEVEKVGQACENLMFDGWQPCKQACWLARHCRPDSSRQPCSYRSPQLWMKSLVQPLPEVFFKVWLCALPQW